MAAIVIAIAALTFTIASFWWLHARRGRLICTEPHRFTAMVNEAVARLRFPLVLENTGPRPVVIQDLQLSFPSDEQTVLPLPWMSVHSTLSADQADVVDHPVPIVVDGFSAQRIIVQFGAPLPGVVLVGRKVAVRIDAQMSLSDKWKELVSFPLLAQGIAYPERYTTYANRINDIPPDAYKKASKAAKRLLETVRDESNGD
ncbi:hypothetical protein [Mumia quercus]|uniref:hypothetical protein n=1 Tax=Mumia quercus TaxID=2976125 RepID=UPI0021D2E4D7|nr:hypothetical protein [Mumia quercus]